MDTFPTQFLSIGEKMDELICYCFGYTASDIEEDVTKNGKSTIMDRILSEKKAGGCQCTIKNPKGRWCLADVRQLVDKATRQDGGAPNPFESLNKMEH